MSAKKLKTPTLEALLKALKQDQEYWNHVYLNGCNDPTWTDGVNLNLIHNHIIYDYEKIKKYYPDEYAKMDIVEPMEMPSEYMARADEIRSAMKKHFVELFDHSDYKEMMQRYEALSPSQKKSIIEPFPIRRIITFESACKEAIESDDLVRMRGLLYHSAEEYHAECRDFIQEMDELEPVEEVVQFTMEL